MSQPRAAPHHNVGVPKASPGCLRRRTIRNAFFNWRRCVTPHVSAVPIRDNHNGDGGSHATARTHDAGNQACLAVVPAEGATARALAARVPELLQVLAPPRQQMIKDFASACSRHEAAAVMFVRDARPVAAAGPFRTHWMLYCRRSHSARWHGAASLADGARPAGVACPIRRHRPPQSK